jgi:hypothetical protein
MSSGGGAAVPLLPIETSSIVASSIVKSAYTTSSITSR